MALFLVIDEKKRYRYEIYERTKRRTREGQSQFYSLKFTLRIIVIDILFSLGQ